MKLYSRTVALLFFLAAAATGALADDAHSLRAKYGELREQDRSTYVAMKRNEYERAQTQIE